MEVMRGGWLARTLPTTMREMLAMRQQMAQGRYGNGKGVFEGIFGGFPSRNFRRAPHMLRARRGRGSSTAASSHCATALERASRGSWTAGLVRSSTSGLFPYSLETGDAEPMQCSAFFGLIERGGCLADLDARSVEPSDSETRESAGSRANVVTAGQETKRCTCV